MGGDKARKTKHETKQRASPSFVSSVTSGLKNTTTVPLSMPALGSTQRASLLSLPSNTHVDGSELQSFYLPLGDPKAININNNTTTPTAWSDGNESWGSLFRKNMKGSLRNPPGSPQVECWNETAEVMEPETNDCSRNSVVVNNRQQQFVDILMTPRTDLGPCMNSSGNKALKKPIFALPEFAFVDEFPSMRSSSMVQPDAASVIDIDMDNSDERRCVESSAPLRLGFSGMNLRRATHWSHRQNNNNYYYNGEMMCCEKKALDTVHLEHTLEMWRIHSKEFSEEKEEEEEEEEEEIGAEREGSSSNGNSSLGKDIIIDCITHRSSLFSGAFPVRDEECSPARRYSFKRSTIREGRKHIPSRAMKEEEEVEVEEKRNEDEEVKGKERKKEPFSMSSYRIFHSFGDRCYSKAYSRRSSTNCSKLFRSRREVVESIPDTFFHRSREDTRSSLCCPVGRNRSFSTNDCLAAGGDGNAPNSVEPSVASSRNMMYHLSHSSTGAMWLTNYRMETVHEAAATTGGGGGMCSPIPSREARSPSCSLTEEQSPHDRPSKRNKSLSGVYLQTLSNNSDVRVSSNPFNVSTTVTTMNTSLSLKMDLSMDALFQVVDVPPEMRLNPGRLMDAAKASLPLPDTRIVANSPLAFTLCSDEFQTLPQCGTTQGGGNSFIMN